MVYGCTRFYCLSSLIDVLFFLCFNGLSLFVINFSLLSKKLSLEDCISVLQFGINAEITVFHL